jgi:hypothetical protein
MTTVPEITPIKEQTMGELIRNRHIVAMCALSSGEDFSYSKLEEYNAEIQRREKEMENVCDDFFGKDNNIILYKRGGYSIYVNCFDETIKRNHFQLFCKIPMYYSWEQLLSTPRNK